MPDAETITRALAGFFASRPDGIAAVYLFGSVARGTARHDSDVDVGVLLRHAPPSDLSGLLLDVQDDLERHLRERVQLVVLNTAPVDLVHRVLRDGQLVFESDRSARIRFEVRVRNEFFDLEPILRRYRGTDASGTASR